VQVQQRACVWSRRSASSTRRRRRHLLCQHCVVVHHEQSHGRLLMRAIGALATTARRRRAAATVKARREPERHLSMQTHAAGHGMGDVMLPEAESGKHNRACSLGANGRVRGDNKPPMPIQRGLLCSNTAEG
jgi:hypothetical protein